MFVYLRMTDTLREDSLNASTSIKIILSYVETSDDSGRTFSDFAWFNRDFPENIPISKWVSTYELVLSLQSA